MRSLNWRPVLGVTAALLIVLGPTRLAHGASPVTSILPESCEFGMERVARLGRGLPYEVVWSPDGARIAIATTLGVDFIDGDDLTYLNESFSSIMPPTSIAWTPIPRALWQLPRLVNCRPEQRMKD